MKSSIDSVKQKFYLIQNAIQTRCLIFHLRLDLQSDGNSSRRLSFAKAIFPILKKLAASGSEAFRKGDFLHVTLETRQWVEGADLKAEHGIVKVHRHESGPTQQKLFSPESDEE